MAKIPEEITVGVVTKVMTCIGWVIIDDEEKCYNDRVYYRYSIAERVCSLYGGGYRVKPIYIEETPK